MTDILAEFSLGSPDVTAQLAERIAPLLGPGDIIALSGPVGAGKSHFARSLILARLADLGRIEDVPSPTFTLVQTYDANTTEIWHADLYRLSDPSEVDELGLADAFETAICLVEWPDRLGGLLPAGSLSVCLAQGEAEDARIVTFSGDAERWKKLRPVLASFAG
ncbi:MAG: tRNA (adenosine(37)-N6)-threonylcarbamoyltransferase complex ATPase subunit type 1 TsaE [Paracoccaceae bacterium]|nr:tRNA (adenosine(37)-N6)-threonylcarbamoyltransferase complex ATPase subunit type 1 TsaE [Paracoccaceae bacterium]